MQPRLRGSAGHRPDADQGGRDAVRRAVLGRARAADRRSTRRTSGWSGPRTTGSTGWPAASFPDHPWRAVPRAQRADAQGPDVRADRRDRRRGDDLAAGDARRRAQLGLPLHVDPRLDVRAVGPLHARLRLGGERLLLLHRRRRRARRASSRSCTASAASASSRSAILDHLQGYEGARPVRIGNGAYNQRQHDVWGAVLDSVYLHTKSRDRLDERIWPILVRQVEAALEHWREPDRGIWEVRGEPKHFTSSKVMCWVAADRGARLAAPARGARARRASGRRPPTRSTPTSARTASTSAASSPSTTTPTALDASLLLMPLVRFLPPDDPRDPGDRARDRRRADGRRPGPALPGRGDRRRPVGRGGHVHDLLVLAGVGAGRDRRARRGRGSCARSCCRSPARSGCTARRSTRTAAATSATSRRRSPTSR